MLSVFILMMRKFISLISVFSMGEWLRHLTLFVPLFLLAYCIVTRRMKSMEILMLILAVISYVMSKDENILFTVLLILAWRNDSPEALIRFWLVIQTVVLAFCTVAYGILYVTGSDLARAEYMDGRFRYFFLFDHPNNYSIQVFFCILAFIYLYADRVPRFLTIVILLALSLFLYELPNSMTATYATLLLAAFLLVEWYARKSLKFIYGALIGVIWFVAYGCVLAIYFGGGQFVSTLFHGTFYERLSSAATLLQMFPLKMFGRNMSVLGQVIRVNGDWRSLWMDLAYIRCFMADGILMGLLFTVLLFRSFILTIKKEQYREALVLAMICIYAMSEWSAFSITTAWGLLFLREGILNYGPYFYFGSKRTERHYLEKSRYEDMIGR